MLENPLDRDCGKPIERSLKRRSYGPREIMAITVKWLSSCAEAKDLYPQFGVTSVVFRKCVELGLLSIVGNMNHQKMRVRWDRSVENMEKMAARRVCGDTIRDVSNAFEAEFGVGKRCTSECVAEIEGSSSHGQYKKSVANVGVCLNAQLLY